MTELPKHLQPAKEEDAPEGYTRCSECKGQKVVGPDGEACVCAVYGQHAGYMKKIVTTIWSCIVCGDALITKDHPHDVDAMEAGPPEPWAKREIIYHPGTENEKKAWRGVCPDCKDLPKEEAYKKVTYTYWIFAEDENDPENWICPSCFTKYEKGPYYLCSKCGYKASRYYDYRWSKKENTSVLEQAIENLFDFLDAHTGTLDPSGAIIIEGPAKEYRILWEQVKDALADTSKWQRDFICEASHPVDPSIELYGFPSELIAKVTKAARAADEAFKTVGGSTRHWVRECFLPCLEEEGLVVVAKKE